MLYEQGINDNNRHGIIIEYEYKTNANHDQINESNEERMNEE